MVNNETIGITAEVFLADLFKVEINEDYRLRADEETLSQLNKESKKIKKVLKNLQLTKHVAEGSSPHDFEAGNKTVSIKTNKDKLGKVCPQIIGQMTPKTYSEYFDREYKEDYQEMSFDFKQDFINNIDMFLREFWENLFNSDYLIYFYNFNEKHIQYFMIETIDMPNFSKEKITFSQNLDTWNNSNTIFYDGVSIAEMQVHSSRKQFTFRFIFPNIVKLFYDIEDEDFKFYNADCFDLLSEIDNNSVDLVLIDPPYAISRSTGFAEGPIRNDDTDRFRVSYEFGNWDMKRFSLKKVIEECYRILKSSGTIICFYDLWKITDLKDYLESANFKQLRFCEWVKTNPTPLNSKTNYLTNSREIFLTAVKGGKPTFNSEYDNAIYEYGICRDKGRFHPTQKPVNLISELIRKHSNERDLVLDCFAGSCTTGVSCMLNNRKFIGCEKETDIYLQAKDRVEEQRRDLNWQEK